jgi:hypothetical protein
MTRQKPSFWEKLDFWLAPSLCLALGERLRPVFAMRLQGVEPLGLIAQR